MTAHTPLEAACTLTGAAAGNRRGRWAATLDAGRARSEAVDGGVRVHLDHRPGLWERLEALAAAERDCCGFLDWTVTTDDDSLRLDVRAPDGDPALVDAVRAEFRRPRATG